MNKPHYIFRQKIERTFDKSGKIIENSTFRNKEQCLTLEEEKAELFDAFSEICDEITPKQRDVINKYWGVSSIRTKEELIQLLK
jgi:DNA-directed RNA polymerase sigma subunit (sigma70/sigma32)